MVNVNWCKSIEELYTQLCCFYCMNYVKEGLTMCYCS